MTDFVRARSEEQKQARMAEIKVAADELFCSVPYQEITLSTIAGKLSWTRANLYKYVTTKEEIYLEICSDKMQSYFDDLFAAFPNVRSSRSMSLHAALPASKQATMHAGIPLSGSWKSVSALAPMMPVKSSYLSCTMLQVYVEAATPIRLCWRL